MRRGLFTDPSSRPLAVSRRPLGAAGRADRKLRPCRAPAGRRPSPARSRPGVSFRVEIDYVEVDAVVTDDRGNIVKGLTRDDFEVFEDGKPQKVELFSQVEVPVERARTLRLSPTAPPVVPDVAFQCQAVRRPALCHRPRRQPHRLPAHRAGQAGGESVHRQVHGRQRHRRGDTGSTDASQDFTNDPRLLHAAEQPVHRATSCARRRWRSSTTTTGSATPRAAERQLGDGNNTDRPRIKARDGLDFERGYKARGTLVALRNLADFMSSIRGRRKAILMFSEGIDYPILDVFDSRDASTIVSDTRDAIAAASKANVNFYTIDPRGLHVHGRRDHGARAASRPIRPTTLNPQAFEQERRLAVDSLRVLAEQTGGFAAVERNDYADAFDRIVRENSSYYVLGYYPAEQQARRQVPRQFEVKLKRPGLQRHRSAKATRPRRARARPPPSHASRGDVERRCGDLINSPLPGRRPDAVGGRGAVRRAEGQRPRWTIGIVGPQPEVHARQGLFTNTVEVSMLPLEARGKAQQGRRSEVKLNLKPQTAQLHGRDRGPPLAAPDPAAGPLPAARRGQGDRRRPSRIGVLQPRSCRTSPRRSST